jgi:iron uptake system component EfeO
MSLVLWLVACKGEEPVELVKEYVTTELDTLAASAVALQEAAPTAPWTSAEAGAMKEAWKDARVSYERVEGAIAVLFPDLDASTDERYDGFIAEAPDTNLFDGEGVTGVHAIERILWADSHPTWVVAFEEALPGYESARFPETAEEATAFREGLCQRLVDDTKSMVDQFEPLALDESTAFRGVIGSMAEQSEKVGLAGSGEDESRYAQFTLTDMRANLEGGQSIYEAFREKVQELEDGETLEADIDAAFARVQAAYDAIDGDAIPEVPSTWNPDAPSEADLATPYGALWSLINAEADPAAAGSLVERLGTAADGLGIPQLPE